MKALRYILPRVNFLTITFEGQDKYSLWFVPYNSSKLNVKELKGQDLSNFESATIQMSKYPLILIFSGVGVICKDALTASDIVEKVKADLETFLSVEHNGKLFFVRRDQLVPIVEKLNSQKAKIVELLCADIQTAQSVQFVRDSVQRLYDTITLKQLIKFDDKCSNLLQLICAKLKLPLLALYMAMLMVAFFVNQSVSSDLEHQNIELVNLRQTVGAIESKGRPEKQMLDKINRKLPYRYAWIFDRVAVVKPYDVKLTSLALQPLKKSICTNDAVAVFDSLVVIKGQASIADDVSLYVERLKNERFATSVKLTSLAQERGGWLFNFQISVKL